MNICFQTIDYARPEEGGGGLATYVRTISRALSRMGHTVIVLAGTKERVKTRTEEDGVVVYRIPLGNLHWYISKIPLVGKSLVLPVREIEWGLDFFFGFRRVLLRERVDIMESSEAGNLFHVICSRVPLVIRTHGDTLISKKMVSGHVSIGDRLCRIMQLWCLKRANLVTTPSAFHAAQIAAECGNGFKATAIPNPVDAFWFSEQEADAASGKGSGLSVLYCGRIEVRKGILILLRAAARVAKEMPGVAFWLAGQTQPGVQETLVKNLSPEERGGAHLHWLWPVSREELKKMYGQCSVFAMPSYYETFGLSCAEAMACGKAVVATRAGALPELVHEDRTGLLVETADPIALAEALLKLLRDASLAASLGANGRRIARERYLPEKIAEGMVGAYRGVLQNAGRGLPS